jgi:hypothetical protein
MATSLSVSATSLTLMDNGHPFEKADQKILDFAFESGLYKSFDISSYAARIHKFKTESGTETKIEPGELITGFTLSKVQKKDGKYRLVACIHTTMEFDTGSKIVNLPVEKCQDIELLEGEDKVVDF